MAFIQIIIQSMRFAIWAPAVNTCALIGVHIDDNIPNGSGVSPGHKNEQHSQSQRTITMLAEIGPP